MTQNFPAAVLTTYSGNIVDLHQRRIFGGTLEVEGNRIRRILPDGEPRDHAAYLMPGFVDAHVHVESSLLVPSEFARLATRHGTVATVSDPHEIANVLGVAGVEYMIANGDTVPFKFFFGAPSCVPATTFETAGAQVTADEVAELLRRREIKYLSEMMNFPGVIHEDPAVKAKIKAAHRAGKPVDGHAPGLRGISLQKYAAAGISTDHECFTREEAEEKLALGMHVLIRDGSAARNFEALFPLLGTHPARCMFCTDDMHPNELLRGHINTLVRRAVEEKGIDVFDALQCACVNPVRHYGLEVGLLREGDPADFIEVDDLRRFNVLRTVIDGAVVAAHGDSLLNPPPAALVNRFAATPKRPEDFAITRRGPIARVIEVIEGQIVTGRRQTPVARWDAEADVAEDILKIAVVNRYQDAPPAVGYIRAFGLRSGAIASSVAHDSHNIIAVGVSNDEICRAVNRIIAHRGGLSVVCRRQNIDALLPLPVAGIMSNEDGFRVARQYEEIDLLAKRLGTPLTAPFMTLSFMGLLVIPTLKMSDKGLFDGESFGFVDLFVDGDGSGDAR